MQKRSILHGRIITKMNQTEILRFLQERVSEDELKVICYNLHVDYESLPAVGKAGKALELVKYMQRRQRLPELEAIASRFGAVGEGTPDSVKPYLKVIAQRTNSLPLAPLDPKGRDAAAISLEQVFINLNAGTATYKAVHAEKELEMTVHQRYSAALAHIHHQRRLILLGDPGSGKSTLLRFLTHCLAQYALDPDKGWQKLLRWSQERLISPEKEIQTAWSQAEQTQQKAKKEEEKPIQRVEHYWSTDALLPILVELRDFASSSFDPRSPAALWQYIENRQRNDGFGEAIPALQTLARQGRLLLLLDGVDEVPLEQRPAVWQAIAALSEGPYLENRWVATCRILSFEAAEAPKGVPVQTLQPLNQAQVKQFIESWYAILVEAGEKSQEQGRALAQQLQAAAKSRLQSLAENPMLLTIMALVQTYHGTLPDERAKLYQACVETLLLRWQRHKETGTSAELPDFLADLGVDQRQLEELLWEIAWKAHSRTISQEKSADIAEAEVMQIASAHLGSYAKAEQFIRYTEQRTHLLIGYGGKKERIYRFPHRTFQEYLAACYLASQRDFPRGAPTLAKRGDTWREVLNLAIGTIVFNQKDVQKAIDCIRDVPPAQLPAVDDAGGWYRVWLAAEMLVVVGKEAALKDKIGRQLLPRLQKQLAALLAAGALTPAQRAEAGDALGLLGDPRPGVCTREPDLIPIPAGPFLMHNNKVAVSVDAFAIARYPVTNAQYRFFVDAGGYGNPDYWTKEGWQQRQKEKWTEPRFWDDPTWNGANKPVVGVSWYEAVAYCHWLSAATGKPYRLPTEAEWERAARHTDGREYPWGDEWQDGIINSSEAKVGRTTAVASFPHSAAHCGAQDLSGNVLEWCQTRYRDEKQKEYPLPYRGDDGRENLSGGNNVTRCCRGGAFPSAYRDCRAAYRDYGDPHFRLGSFGFRVVVAEHLSS